MTLHNIWAHEITLDLVSCFEAVLADPRADEAHPAFSNLFIADPLARRTGGPCCSRASPRLQGDPAMAVAHFLAAADADVRLRRLPSPTAGPSSDATGCRPHRRCWRTGRAGRGAPVNGLDPVACLCVRVRIAAGEVARLTFATAAAETSDELIARIDNYLQPMHVERATRMAATLAQVRLRDLGVAPERNAALQDLNTALMYTATRPQTERTLLDQRQLWRFGLSGDKPIVLVRIHSGNGLSLVDALLRAQPWWSFGGLAVDVVIINSEPNSYLMPLQRDILVLHDRMRQQSENSFPRNDAGGFFLLRDHEMAATEKAVLAGLARFIFVADGRPLEQQLAALQGATGLRRRAVPASPPVPSTALADPSAAPLAATQLPAGEFDAATGEFRFDRGPATPSATPVDQRDRQSVLRLPGVRSRRRLHLGRQQPHAPAHPLVERPGAGPGGRALPAAGRRHTKAAGADALH